MAFYPSADCEGWSGTLPWCTSSYGTASATLQRLEDGSWVDVETLSSESCLSTPDAVCANHEFSGSWSGALDGTYRVVFSATVYNNVYGACPIDTTEWPFVYPFGEETSASFDCLPPPPPPPEHNGARTPGYWRNHEEAWGASSLTIGSQSYSAACLDAFFDVPTVGDIRVILIHHLVAAKLNLLPSPIPGIGSTDPTTITGYPDATSTIVDTIAAADAYLSSTTIDCATNSLSGSAPKGAVKAVGAAIKDALDAYNNNVSFGSSSSPLEAASAEDEASGCTSVGGKADLFTLMLPAFAVALLRNRRRN